MANVHHGASLMLEFQKVRFSDFCFFNLYKRPDRKSSIKAKTFWRRHLFAYMSTINDPNATAKQLCEDLDKIKKWAFQWKMGFNPDLSKQAQEVIFTRQVKKVVHPPIFFNNKPVQQVSSLVNP